MQLREALEAVVGGGALERAQSRAVFEEVLGGGTDAIQFGGLLTALAARRETRSELLGAADALRSAMEVFEHDHPDAIDTCGTGGDGLGTFNFSTASAIVACAAGARVIKHGNRSSSSPCGSADLLEAAGLPLELSPRASRAVLDEVGITFLYAPSYHPAMRFAGPVRRALGVRTVFNLLGPLCNPGRVRRQLLGVSDPTRLQEMGDVLEALGHERALVVHGAGGADELTLAGPNLLRPVGDLPGATFDGADLGLAAAGVEAIAGGDVAHNLGLLGRLLDGEGGPHGDTLLLNTGAALVVAGVAEDGRDGVERARDAVRSGAARAKLEAWIASARRLQGERR